MFTQSTDSDNRQRVWKYVLVGVIALVGVVVLAHATLNRNSDVVGRQTALQGIVGDLIEGSEPLEAAADSTYFVISAGNFHQVNAGCRQRGGKLASISSYTENQQVKSACGRNRVCYIGLTDMSHEGTFRWTDGTPYSYRRWARGEPNNVGNEDCVEMYSASGQWNDIPCGHRIPAVCEKAVPGPNKYFLTQHASTFHGVQAQCAAKGATLASVTSSADVAEAKQVCDGKRTCYIGLNDIAHEGRWKWVDNTPYSFRYWNAGEPNNAGNEDCVEMYTANGKWNDIRCSSRLYGICEPKPPKYFLSRSPGNYDQLKADCARQGGKLASIKSSAENSAVRAVCDGKGHCLIGLTLAKEYKWQDGSAATYKNWDSREPNNAGGESCVEIRPNGKWNDIPCSHRKYGVCERN